jgi:hypothetical protein
MPRFQSQLHPTKLAGGSAVAALAATLAFCLLAFVSGCVEETGGPADPGDDECQIKAEGEKSPGYPYDLAEYGEKVLPMLQTNCSAVGCHAAPTGQKNFTVWAQAAVGDCGYAQTFNSLSDFVDLASPSNSAVIVSVSGALPTHPFILPPEDERYQLLLNYITKASQLFIADGGAGNTPPPGASPFDYAVFQNAIQPILDTAEDRGCAQSACHGTGAGNFRLTATPGRDSAEMEANFIEVTRRMNLASPETSLFYLQATTRHGANASVLASREQAEAILAWIKTAAENSGGENPGCAPIERFNLNVFGDEILPLLAGDLDYNNPGGGTTTTGCMRGPCHGTDRGPGILYLTEGQEAAKNLANFACFVDLRNPSQSQVLLCPLDDPGCKRRPHPGQDVFGGADDLNYQKLLAFLYGSQLDATPLDFAFFVRRVNPIFNDVNAVEGGAQGRTCGDAASCHGVSVAGQPPPNGSNFPIIPNATDKARLTFNFASAANFINFLDPDESSLFLYPTNEIANVVDHPFATGLPHPGGEDFAVDSNEARTILKFAQGLRPDGNGFINDFLVAGDYPATQISDLTPINEIGSTPAIFDSSGAQQFNNGQWDGFFAGDENIDLDVAFPRGATSGRVAYAVVYLTNTTSTDITAQVILDTDNAARVYVGNALVAQADGTPISAVATLPSYRASKTTTRLMVKLLQRSTDDDFRFTLALRDEFGRPLTDTSGEIVVQLGPQGGI